MVRNITHFSICFIVLFLAVSCVKQDAVFTYPEIERVDRVEVFFNTSIVDSYSSLENLKDLEVINWFKKQATITNDILPAINADFFYDKMIDYEKRQSKDVYDNYRITNKKSYFLLKNEAESSQLFYKVNKDSIPVLIFDSSAITSNHGITAYYPSPDASKIVVAVAPKGKSKNQLLIYDVQKQELLKDLIQDVNPDYFGGITWLNDNSGFIYQKLPHFQTEAIDYSYNSQAKLHVLGTESLFDIDIFSKKSQPNLPIKEEDFPYVSMDRNYDNLLFGSISGSSAYQDTYWTEIKNDYNNLQWSLFFSQNEKIAQYFLEDGNVIFRTAKNAPTFKICRTPLKNPKFNEAEVLINSEENSVINDFTILNSVIYYTTVKNGVEAKFFKYDIQRKTTTEIDLPLPSGTSYVARRANDIQLSINGWTTPSTLYNYNYERGDFTNIEPIKPRNNSFDNIIIEEIEVPSHDGTLVPLSLIYKNGIKKDMARVIITGYGAYGFSSSPFFYLPYVTWVDEGNILAIAHVRGGGEKGDTWHKNGTKTSKSNTWKDVIACTSYLHKNGFSRPEKTIIYGVSAGGITAGKAIMERPDLYSVALLDVPFLHAMRSEFQPNGANSVKEFGTIKDSLEFKALLQMDVYHSINSKKQYPAMYVTTGMNDGSVTPWDPGKFVAKMQNQSSSIRPILFQVDFNSGHSGDGTMHGFYKNMSCMFAFALWQTKHPNFQPEHPIVIKRPN